VANLDDGRPSHREEREERSEHHDPRQDGAAKSSTRGAWRTAAWLFLITATGALVTGIAIGQGLLIATGLVLAGVSGHLFTPEYTQKYTQKRNSRRPPAPPY
jgi:hypothetical protein